MKLCLQYEALQHLFLRPLFYRHIWCLHFRLYSAMKGVHSWKKMRTMFKTRPDRITTHKARNVSWGISFPPMSIYGVWLGKCLVNVLPNLLISEAQWKKRWQDSVEDDPEDVIVKEIFHWLSDGSPSVLNHQELSSPLGCLGRRWSEMAVLVSITEEASRQSIGLLATILKARHTLPWQRLCRGCLYVFIESLAKGQKG